MFSTNMLIERILFVIEGLINSIPIVPTYETDILPILLDLLISSSDLTIRIVNETFIKGLGKER